MKRWRLLAVILCAVWGIVMILPTFLSRPMRDHLPGWMPEKTMTLGLDLRGGVHLCLEVDAQHYIQERCQSITPFLRQVLLKEKILYRNLNSIPGGTSLTLVNPNDMARFKAVAQVMDNIDLEIRPSANGVVQVFLPESSKATMTQDVMSRSVEIIRKRIDETGAVEPVIQEQGTNRIILQIPGFEDPARVRELLGKTAKLTFHWTSPKHALNTLTLPYAQDPDATISIDKTPVMSGEDVLRSRADYQTNTYGMDQPVVTMEFTPKGQRIFSDLTAPENHKRILAIVLDKEVLSTPVIQSHITGGSAVISGKMSLEAAQKLATLINSGALPAPLSVLEEKVIGPGLGTDSIIAGTKGTLMAIVAVAIWMLLIYDSFGIFAVIGILFNLLFLLALLILIGATLTLPGLAGIALTVGMSVDANVLINERIKEEWRQGKSVRDAIYHGYERAWKSIFDSNITTLTGAILLYMNGSGPVRGFAVTMGLGILISLFTAIGLTRMIVLEWLRLRKPTTLSI